MARITVEDCLEKVGNRFELVMLASRRAHDLAKRGLEATVKWKNDKPTVVALREIAEGTVTMEYLKSKATASRDELKGDVEAA